MLAISRFLKKNPTKSVIVVAPNDPVRKQWITDSLEWNIYSNCKFITMTEAIASKYQCSLLVIDENKFCQCKTHLIAGIS